MVFRLKQLLVVALPLISILLLITAKLTLFVRRKDGPPRRFWRPRHAASRIFWIQACQVRLWSEQFSPSQ